MAAHIQGSASADRDPYRDTAGRGGRGRSHRREPLEQSHITAETLRTQLRDRQPGSPWPPGQRPGPGWISARRRPRRRTRRTAPSRCRPTRSARRAWPARTSWATAARCPTRTCRRSSRRTSSTRVPAASGSTTRSSSPRAPSPPRPRSGPCCAAGSVVAIMFGFNGDNLLLTGTGRSLRQGEVRQRGLGSRCSPRWPTATARPSTGPPTVTSPGGCSDPGAGHRQRRAGLPDRARLRRRGPGPERQRGHHLPADRQRPDRAGLRGQRGRPGRRRPRSTTAATMRWSTSSWTRPWAARRMSSTT